MNKKEHLKWWDINLNKREKDFINWLEKSDYGSRNFIFNFLDKNNDIKNVLECGPGTFIDHNTYFKKSNKKYSAIDITDSIVNQGLKKRIDITLSSIEDIKKESNSFNLVYCRHVLEHQDYFEKSLEEMIRVSNKYVIVTFFLLSENKDDIINYDKESKLYHNSYSMYKIEKFIESRNFKYKWEFLKNDKILIIEK